jgi:hypothetical protein
MDLDVVKDMQKSQSCCQLCLGAGTIRVYGQDSDQTAEYFDITWVGDVKKKFEQVNGYMDLLNNRNRVNFNTNQAQP